MNGTTVNEPINPLFLNFGTGTFQWGLFIIASCINILAIFGIPLNASVCYVTYKYRHIHPSFKCNTSVLIAFTSFFEILHQTGHPFFLWNAVTGNNFFPLYQALPLQAISIVGINSGSKLLALLSIDRLLAIAAPLFYRNLNQRLYLSAHMLVILGFNVFFFVTLIRAYQLYPNWQLTGYVGELLTSVPGVGQTLMFISFGVFSTTILVYLLVGILVKVKTEVTTERQKKIYHSLFLIVFVNVGGYFVVNTVTVLRLLSLLPSLPFNTWYLGQFAVILLNIAAAANAPILYSNSTEYRNAFRKELAKLRTAFAWLICQRKVHPQTIPITTVLPANNNPRSHQITPPQFS